MSQQLNSEFFRRYDLVEARKNPSQRFPASHQEEALAKLRNWFEAKSNPQNNGGLLVLPTGGGKTFVAVRFLCDGPLSQGYKVLWLAHTHHLLEQALNSFGLEDEESVSKSDLEVGRILGPKKYLSVRVVSGTPGHFPIHSIKPDDDVVIGTLQTVTRAYQDKQQHSLKKF